MLTTPDALQTTLQQVFGYSTFRQEQVRIISSILDGRDTLVIMPTGAGKSLCYQLPAVFQAQTALVISPLIALMKNQVDKLSSLGVEARFLNSTLGRKEVKQIKKSVQAQQVRLLYIAPEAFTKAENLPFFQSIPIGLIAIDEAHCISEWGHDFRPEYRRIREVADKLPQKSIPLIALTATATGRVKEDIIKSLRLDSPNIFASSFNRENLFYEIILKENPEKQLIEYLHGKANQSGIIYCLTRKKVEEITQLLLANKIAASPYHAGLDSKVRVKNQEAFLDKKTQIIVATIAFGMGIDKPDVRFVLHYELPKSLEGYYQETGRAGRDGQYAQCTLLYTPKDLFLIEKFSKNLLHPEKDHTKHLIDKLKQYIESSSCRRERLLNYFGEKYDGDCGLCDNCTRKHAVFNATQALRQLLVLAEKIPHLDEDETIQLLDDSDQRKKVCPAPIYKELSAYTQEVWRGILHQAIHHKYLNYKLGQAPWVVTAKGLRFISQPATVYFRESRNYNPRKTDLSTTLDVVDPLLFKMLLSLQHQVGKEASIPDYAVFQEASLQEMATYYPTTKEDLLQINGVGSRKVTKFGEPFLHLIKKYVKENDIIAHNNILVKLSPKNASVKMRIISQVDKKIQIEDIAESMSLPMMKVVKEMEEISKSGTFLNIDYHINCILEEDRQQEIWHYFMHAQNDNIDQAIKVLNDYTEEEVRLMRIKFLSEVAN